MIISGFYLTKWAFCNSGQLPTLCEPRWFNKRIILSCEVTQLMKKVVSYTLVGSVLNMLAGINHSTERRGGVLKR